MRKLLLAFAVAFVAAAPAFAQDKPFELNFGGGASVPVSGFKDSFNTGWNFNVGGTFNFSPTLGFQVEYMYNRMNGPDKTITVFPTPSASGGTGQLIQSNHQMHVGTFDLIAHSRGGETVNGYFLGGVGVYHRMIQLTSPAVGYTTVCDPYWLVCYPTAVSMDRILGDRSSNDFGINFGGGITFGHDAKFYVEARYHYVWGPEFTGASGTKQSSNAQYIPFTFGVRF